MEEKTFKSEHQFDLLTLIQDWSINEGYFRYIDKIIFKPFNGKYVEATVFHKEVTIV